MQVIKEYVFSLMIISFSGAALELLSPENTRLSKYVHFICALVISVVILSPLQSLMGVLPDIFDIEYDLSAFDESAESAVYIDNIIDESISGIENEIKNSIESKFGVSPAIITLEYNAEDIENILITKVLVGYTEDNKYLYSDTVSYIEELMKCECEVYFADE